LGRKRLALSNSVPKRTREKVGKKSQGLRIRDRDPLGQQSELIPYL
jgi:hypothetical protein